MTDTGHSRDFIASGGAWVVLQSVLLTAVLVLAVVFPGDWTHRALIAAGFVLFGLGAVIGIAGVAALGRNRTAFPQPQDGSELVRCGIYAHVRHPLYTSVMLSSLGWALGWQSGPACLAALVLLPFFHLKARAEERWLRARFPEYADYERHVPRFLPQFRHPR